MLNILSFRAALEKLIQKFYFIKNFCRKLVGRYQWDRLVSVLKSVKGMHTKSLKFVHT